MKVSLFLLLCCTGSLEAIAQDKPSVKGSIADTSSGDKLANTSISILNAKDSTLVKFARAAKDGSFSISQIPYGNYLLMACYPGYADYLEGFVLDALNAHYDFKLISMTLKSKLLENVIVRGVRTPIRIRGDTTEYNASSFVIKPGDKVEDLLRQLPGIQVDKDGKITAQGKAVNKVLVDGEEFFGDDPTLVTKNLRSDMIDKVQLFDKKTDRAELTGVDDGVLNKTINVTLKEDKKNGYFGKVEAGIGTGKFYQEQALFNRFKGKRKVSVYGSLANTGKTGLGYAEMEVTGTFDESMQMEADGSVMIMGGR